MNNLFQSSDGIRVKELLEKLKTCADLYVFGGAVRDHLFGKGQHKPKDFDIVYWGDKDELERKTDTYLMKYNKMGGRKLLFKDVEVDIWHIKDSKYLQKSKCFSLTSLLNSTYSSLESVAYSYNQDRYYASQLFYDTHRKNKIKIINPNNFYPLKASLKLIKMSMLFNLKIDKDSSENIRNVLQSNIYGDILERWGKIIDGNDSVIDAILNDTNCININLKKHNIAIDRRSIPILRKHTRGNVKKFNLI